MAKYLIGVLVLVFAATAAMYFFVGVSQIYKEVGPNQGLPHYFKDPSQSIAKINLTAFYFVPKNKQDRAIANWQEVLEANLKKVQEFHNFQLQERSDFSYQIYPEIVIGEHENIFYDTDVTQHGNPEALRGIAEELKKRMLFGKDSGNEYRVALIMYEGVGASGGGNIALVSRVFLTDSRYGAVSSSILAHEFYHTLGLPDAYILETSAPTSEDIMGLGRERPIERAFIGRKTLNELGI